MAKDISTFVKNCSFCKINKPKPYTKEELSITETPTKPFETVYIDLMGPFEISAQGNRFLLTIICGFSKYLVSVPIQNKEAKTVAKAFVEQFVLLFGNPCNIISDMGTEFKNLVFAKVASMFQINHSFSTAYHYETLGAVERSHRTMNEYLRTFMKDSRSNWDEISYFFNICYNTSPHSAIDYYSPFELVFGRQYHLHNIVSSLPQSYNYDSYANELSVLLKKAHERALLCTEKRKISIKKSFDQKTYPIHVRVGDKVLLRDAARHKLDPIFLEGFTVEEINADGNVVLKSDEGNVIKVHKNRIVGI